MCITQNSGMIEFGKIPVEFYSMSVHIHTDIAAVHSPVRLDLKTKFPYFLIFLPWLMLTSYGHIKKPKLYHRFFDDFSLGLSLSNAFLNIIYRY